MGTAKTRREKQAWIEMVLSMAVKGKKEPLSKKKLLAEFSLQMFSSRRTGLEILKAMEASERIKIEGDNVSCHGMQRLE